MFYKVNSAKVTVREYLFEAGFLLIPIALFIAGLSRLFRLRLSGSTDFPPVDRLSDYLCEMHDVDAELTSAIATERQWLETQRFNYCGDIFINDPTHNTRYASCVYLSPDGATIAWVRVRRFPNLSAKGRATRVQLTTVTEDDRVLITTSANRDLLEPARWDIHFQTGAVVSALYQLHDHRRSQLFSSHRAKVFSTAAAVLDQLDGLQSEFAAFQKSRCVFEEVTMTKWTSPQPVVASSPPQSAMRSVEPSQPLAPLVLAEANSHSGPVTGEPIFAATIARPGAVSADDLVIAEVRKQETKQTQLWTKLLLLGVSLAVFVGVGGIAQDKSYFLMIIPILFVHELGHLIAMKTFGYKNVNMFYIPLFGAAVTGRHYNVAGWKKALVSLAGPVPSIAIAIVLEIIGFVFELQWLNMAALLMFVLNVFNLLPFLPFDGGWVAHITLFSRSKHLDIGFRVVTAIALFGITLVTGDKILMYLGIGMAVGLPAVWRTLKVQEQLANVPMMASNDDLIPEAAIRQIYKACQSANLPAANSSQLAATTIRVYEALNTTPPSWPATIGLWALHGGAVATGLVGILVFVAGSMFSQLDPSKTKYETVRIEIPTDKIHVRPGTAPMPETALLTWNFRDHETALRAATSLQQTTSHSVCQLGTLVIASETDNSNLAVRRRAGPMSDIFTNPTVVEQQARNDPALRALRDLFQPIDARSFRPFQFAFPRLQVSFDSPESLNKVVATFATLTSFDTHKYMLPPWSPEQKPTPEQVRLRRLLGILQERDTKRPWTTDAPPALSREQREAFKTMDEKQRMDVLTKLQQERQAWFTDAAAKKTEWVNAGLARSTGETKTLVESYLRFETDTKAAQEKLRQLIADRQKGTVEVTESADDIFPKMADYFRDSEAALGIIDTSAKEYRYAAIVYTSVDSGTFENEGEEFLEELDEDESMFASPNETATTLNVNVQASGDSAATMGALLAWLKEQNAVSMTWSYSRVVLPTVAP